MTWYVNFRFISLSARRGHWYFLAAVLMYSVRKRINLNLMLLLFFLFLTQFSSWQGFFRSTFKDHTSWDHYIFSSLHVMFYMFVTLIETTFLTTNVPSTFSKWSTYNCDDWFNSRMSTLLDFRHSLHPFLILYNNSGLYIHAVSMIMLPTDGCHGLRNGLLHLSFTVFLVTDDTCSAKNRPKGAKYSLFTKCYESTL